jgi:hypothetical protein
MVCCGDWNTSLAICTRLDESPEHYVSQCVRLAQFPGVLTNESAPAAEARQRGAKNIRADDVQNGHGLRSTWIV